MWGWGNENALTVLQKTIIIFYINYLLLYFFFSSLFDRDYLRLRFLVVTDLFRDPILPVFRAGPQPRYISKRISKDIIKRYQKLWLKEYKKIFARMTEDISENYK